MNKKLPIKLNIPSGFLDDEERFGYKISSRIKEIWAVELDLYEELRRVCNKHHLSLMADAGTILGTVRDSGFIPWDDDLDFSMSRDDYQKLCEVAKDEFKYPYFWQTDDTDPGSCRGHGQLRNSETTAILKSDVYDGKYFGFNQGIFIDVFPFDLVPEDDVERHNFLVEIQRLIIKKNAYRDVKSGLNLSTGFKRTIKDIMIRYYYSKTKYYNRAEKKLERLKTKYQHSDSKLVANLFYVHLDRPDIFVRKKEWFEDFVEFPFEFTTMNVPCGYVAYLEKAYGDWHKRLLDKNAHGGLICDPKKPYKKYIDEMRV